ncbi:MAG: hypothetical protein H7227_01300 [Actinobacteria bacterium]|nr:hypothetical protein [Actinomycetota bacterium]
MNALARVQRKVRGYISLRSRHMAVTAALASALLLVESALILPAGSALSPPRKILTGWIPYYSTSTSLTSAVLNGDLVQEVMPFWYTLKSESKISDLYTPANPSIPMSLPMGVMKDSGFKVIPTITDGTSKAVLAGLLARSTIRTVMVNSIVNLVVRNNFDGIDLDFEGFAFVDGSASWNATQPNWVLFVKELSAALHSENRLLSITTPVLFDPTAGKKGYYIYDWASIAPVIDRLRIMTYDYSTATPGPIGPLNWIEESLKYAVSVVPASKIFIGVAGYGRDWVTKVTGSCPSSVASAVSTKAKAATFVMRDAANLAATYGAKPSYHTTFAEVNFTYQKIYNGTTSSGLATSCTATRVAWFQDSRAYAARAKLVAKYHIGGITAWTLGMEDTTATESVRQVAQSIAPDAITSEMVVDKATVAYGDAVFVAGHFQLSDKEPVAGLTVRVQIRRNGESEWQEILEAVTDEQGSVIVPLLLSRTTSVRMLSDATWERLASTSQEIMILVSRSIDIAPPTSAKVGELFAIAGAVQPQEEGVSLSLEKLVLGSWRQIGTPVVTDATGAFSLSVTENARGVGRYRVKAAGDERMQGSDSSTFSIVVY